MNYFLLANNKDIKQSTIDKLPLNEKTDRLVLFNFLFPLKFDKIKFYLNKICVSRERAIQYRINSTLINGIKEYYANIGDIRKYQNLFKEIYFLPCPNNINTKTISEEYINHISLYNFDSHKIKCIDINYDIHKTSEQLNYLIQGKVAEPSTGVIIYNYLKKIKKIDDSIILVFFNSDLNNNFHDKDWETKYFLNEIEQQKCLTIDCYNVPDTYNN